jgi:hypothetical protein
MAQKKRDAYAFGDDPVIEDGHSVRVPVMICDTAGHRPGYANADLNWKQLADLRRVTEARLQTLDAKRRRPPDDDDDDDKEIASLEDVRRPSIEARNAYVRSLSDAWRYPAPVQLTAGKPFPSRDGKNAADPDPEDSPQAKRDAAYAEYSASISNAWKNVPAQNNPRAASGIERLREQTAGK